MWGCSAAQVPQTQIIVSVQADNAEIQVEIPTRSTVQGALNFAKITVAALDRIEPPLYTVLSDGSQIKVIRVREEYYKERVVIPFDHQEVRNEALPEGETRLSQAGENGLEEVTYRRLFEDGKEISVEEISRVMVKEPIPEIVMTGSSPIFESVNFPGRIAYLSAGNAWIIDNTTGNRRCVVPTGDLDGRIFSLSRDKKYLLFTRYSKDIDQINSLWVATLESDPIGLVDLGVRDIVHYAEFNPESSIIAYSTAEWRKTAPGWQANNDLSELDFDPSGAIDEPKVILDSSSGGVYGWWGMDLAWAPDQQHFLYSRPDSIGIIEYRNGVQTSLLNIIPYQTSGNWAWVPGAAWSPDGNTIYTVNRVATKDQENAEPFQFDLVEIPLTGGDPVTLIKNVGMFAHPIPSPKDQNGFLVAYLQAVFPGQSETSVYKLAIVNHDGSNPKILFPSEGNAGLKPQGVVWSPVSLDTSGAYAIALIYNGNIWIIDSGTGVARQITTDGLTSRLDWR